MKRRSKYRKHVEQSVLDSFPEPEDGEEVVIVVASRGGNILEVRPLKGTDAEPSLCLLPSKFKKLVWVRRGTMLIVTSADEDYLTSTGSKGKVKYTVKHILFHDQVKHLMKLGIIPDTEKEKEGELRQPKIEAETDEGDICQSVPPHDENDEKNSSGLESSVKQKEGGDTKIVKHIHNKVEETHSTSDSVSGISDKKVELDSRTCSNCNGRILLHNTMDSVEEGISNLNVVSTNLEDDEVTDREEEDSYPDLVANTNRRGGYVSSSEESETESEEN